jgi:hypothetical protein
MSGGYMNTHDQTSSKSPHKDRFDRFAEIGPVWLSSIAALIVALTGTGFFAGRVTAQTQPRPTKTVTATVTVMASPVVHQGGTGNPTSTPSASATAAEATSWLMSLQPATGSTSTLVPGPQAILTSTGNQSYANSLAFTGCAESGGATYYLNGKYIGFHTVFGLGGADESANLTINIDGTKTTYEASSGHEEQISLSIKGVRQMTLTLSGNCLEVPVVLGDAELFR